PPPLVQQSCANIFLNNGIGNCGREIGCICANKDFISAISCCLINECDAADQQKAIDFAQQLCQANQVSVPNTVVCTSTSSSGAAGATTTTSSSSTPADNSATTTTTGTSSSTSSSASGSGSAASQSSTSTSASGNFGPRQTAAPMLGALGGIVAVAALI
ncbi:hypothetical protein NKR19_g5042, partial [Coniochaeta hoffmannii]